jgi:hypothetical protein
MLFVLYLAGLALLIVVLALGLDLVQGGPARRRAATAAGPADGGREEPRVAIGEPTPSGSAAGSAALAGPVISAGAGETRPAPPRPEPRRWPGRETAILVAVTIVALFALGSDWIFYHELTQLRAEQRAWLGPQAARSERPPTLGRDFEVAVAYQNTGREPASDVVSEAAPFAVALDQASSATVDRKIKDAAEHCAALAPGSGTKVVYPSAAAAGEHTGVTVRKELIDSEFMYGVKILVVPGCYAYKSGGATHHSAFCFFYQHGFSNPTSWPLCQAGNYAD